MREGSSQTKRHVRVERGIYRRETSSGTVYEFNYTDSVGKTRWSTTRTLKEAREGRGAKLAAVARGERVVKSTATVAELAESWFEARSARVRKRTSDYYRQSLDLVVLPSFGRMKIAAVDVDCIAKLIRDLEREGLHAIDATRPVRPLGRSSVVNYLKPLNGVLALALRRGLIAANPFALLTSDDRPVREDEKPAHEWTDAEVAALLAASASLAARPVSKYDYTPVLRFVALLGLRKGEALGLRWEDFDRDGYLDVRRQWLDTREFGPTKTRAGVRRIALPAEVRDELIGMRLASRFSLDTDPIFASKSGSPLGHRNVSRRGFEAARDLAELPSDLTLHDLRHAAASRLIAAGLDPVTVAAVLGHEDATVTLSIYGHLYDRRRNDEAVRRALAG
jgi:integrase